MSASRNRGAALAAGLFVAAAAAAAPPAAAFLTPATHTARVGEQVALRIRSGPAQSAQPAPWPAAEIEWLLVRSGTTQENRHQPRPAREGDDFVTVEIKDPGVTLIGADQRPAVRECTGRELIEFLNEHVSRQLAERGVRPPAPDSTCRVRHVLSAKALIRADAGAAAQPSGVALGKTGQAVELRPLVDPTTAKVGGDVPLCFYIAGDKTAGVKVQATHVATGQVGVFVTDSAGSGFVRIRQPGLWRVAAHHAAPLENDPAADWVLYTATLTFEVPKGAEP